MLVGTITLATCYGRADIPVELLGKGPRPGTARVRALHGLEPFTKISHGGPYQDSSAVVLTGNLRNIHVEADPEGAGAKEPSEPPSRPIPADWFLEMAYEDRTFSE